MVRDKVGLILVLIGVCIPLAALPFVSGYSKERGFIQNLYKVGIVIGSGKQAGDVKPGSPPAAEKKRFGGFDPARLMPEMIPFRFILAIAIVFLFMGIVHIDRARKHGASESEDERE